MLLVLSCIMFIVNAFMSQFSPYMCWTLGDFGWFCIPENEYLHMYTFAMIWLRQVGALPNSSAEYLCISSVCSAGFMLHMTVSCAFTFSDFHSRVQFSMEVSCRLSFARFELLQPVVVNHVSTIKIDVRSWTATCVKCQQPVLYSNPSQTICHQTNLTSYWFGHFDCRC